MCRSTSSFHIAHQAEAVFYNSSDDARTAVTTPKRTCREVPNFTTETDELPAVTVVEVPLAFVVLFMVRSGHPQVLPWLSTPTVPMIPVVEFVQLQVLVETTVVVVFVPLTLVLFWEIEMLPVAVLL